MKKRSECHCSCHVKVDGRPIAMHVMPCCIPDPPRPLIFDPEHYPENRTEDDPST
jgi:hypothetical protein